MATRTQQIASEIYKAYGTEPQELAKACALVITAIIASVASDRADAAEGLAALTKVMAYDVETMVMRKSH